jgi:mono/diheme cytochrome c family protein
MMPLTKSGRGLLALAAMAVLSLGAAGAQENLDRGKPAPKLFAESCVTCHRSARGLANGRFTLTLYAFLQQHYASNSGSAWELASYLNSVDSAKQAKTRAAAHSPRPAASNASTSLRPPVPVPGR